MMFWSGACISADSADSGRPDNYPTAGFRMTPPLQPGRLFNLSAVRCSRHSPSAAASAQAAAEAVEDPRPLAASAPFAPLPATEASDAGRRSPSAAPTARMAAAAVEDRRHVAASAAVAQRTAADAKASRHLPPSAPPPITAGAEPDGLSAFLAAVQPAAPPRQWAIAWARA